MTFSVRHLIALTAYVAFGMFRPTPATLGAENYNAAMLTIRVGGGLMGLTAYLAVATVRNKQKHGNDE